MTTQTNTLDALLVQHETALASSPRLRTCWGADKLLGITRDAVSPSPFQAAMVTASQPSNALARKILSVGRLTRCCCVLNRL